MSQTYSVPHTGVPVLSGKGTPNSWNSVAGELALPAPFSSFPPSNLLSFQILFSSLKWGEEQQLSNLALGTPHIYLYPSPHSEVF